MGRQVFSLSDKRASIILDGYHYCGISKKKVKQENGFVWCEGNTTCKNKSCTTKLFSRDEEAPENEPDSWEFEAKSNIKIHIKDARIYQAFCVDKIIL